MKTITLNIDEALLDQITSIAEKHNTSINSIICGRSCKVPIDSGDYISAELLLSRALVITENH